MDAITLIKVQHVEIDELFEQLKKARSDQKKRALFAELADKLVTHMTMEEQIFYPSIKARSIMDELLEANEEHLAIRRVLADLLDTPPSDPRFGAQVSVVSEQHDHHAHHEEEEGLFPKVLKLVSKDELDALGGEMLSFYEQEVTKAPRRHLPEETEQAAAI